MCSTNCDCTQLTEAVESQLSTQASKVCRKCGDKPFIILEKIHVECKKCFLESCHRKIRSTIGRSKLVKNNDPILIAHSGGPSSCALLDLIKSSINSSGGRYQKFRPSIVHIDTQINATAPDRSRKLKLLLENVHSQYPDWPLYWTCIEFCKQQETATQAFWYSRYESRDGLEVSLPQQVLEPSQVLFNKTLEGLDNLTDQQQFVQDQCSYLINCIATKISDLGKKPDDCFTYVFTASSATQLANDLLVSVILGRGSTICSTTSVCDNRSNIPVLRPMRDFSKKEIAFYLKARKIEPPTEMPANLLTFAGRKASIQTVTEAFLSKLDVDFPSTYSTLLRTGNKMQD